MMHKVSLHFCPVWIEETRREGRSVLAADWAVSSAGNETNGRPWSTSTVARVCGACVCRLVEIVAFPAQRLPSRNAVASSTLRNVGTTMPPALESNHHLSKSFGPEGIVTGSKEPCLCSHIFRRLIMVAYIAPSDVRNRAWILREAR